VKFLSKTFLSTAFSFPDIKLDHLKWDTLYKREDEKDGASVKGQV